MLGQSPGALSVMNEVRVADASRLSAGPHPAAEDIERCALGGVLAVIGHRIDAAFERLEERAALRRNRFDLAQRRIAAGGELEGAGGAVVVVLPDPDEVLLVGTFSPLSQAGTAMSDKTDKATRTVETSDFMRALRAAYEHDDGVHGCD